MSSRKPNSKQPAYDRMVEDAPPEDNLPEDAEAAERASLLPRPDQGRSSNQDETDHKDQSSSAQSALVVTVAVGALLMMGDIAYSVAIAPRMVIFEDVICRQYYAEVQDVADGLDCKIDPIQSELARINGWKDTLSLIPGLVLSIPYAALANRIGSNVVLSMALVGMLLNEVWIAIVSAMPQVFPLRAIWLAGLFTIFGGGRVAVISICYAKLGNACRPHQRTTAFSLVHAAVLLSEMFSIPLGSAFISWNPWIPILGALGLRLAFTLFTIGVTVKYRLGTTVPENDDQPLPIISSSPRRNVRDRVSSGIEKLAESSVWITKDVILLLVAFAVTQISGQSTSVLLQYSSLKLHWDYAKASFLITLRAGVNLLVLFALIPTASRYLRRMGMASPLVDKYLTVTSGMLLVVGSLLIFLSVTPTSLIFGQTMLAAGLAFSVTGRSFLSNLVDPRYMSLLFTSVTAVSHVGLIVGGPLLAGVFKIGLDVGDVWIGLPFLVTAILFALGTIAAACASASKESDII